MQLLRPPGRLDRLVVPAGLVVGDREIVQEGRVGRGGLQPLEAVVDPPAVELGRVPEELPGDEFERPREAGPLHLDRVVVPRARRDDRRHQ